MKKQLLLFIPILALLHTFNCYAQKATVKIPKYNDKYTRYVKQMEGGDTDINYTDFRESFLDSKQYDKKDEKYDDLKGEISDAVRNNDYEKVIEITKAMLSIDYTSMYAHKFLQQTYKILGDSANCKKYKAIEFGLLNSIIKSGTGKSCERGWHVTQIEEEYFILYILGARFDMQSIDGSEHNTCDAMSVTMEDGEKRTYYFEINKIFSRTEKMFKKK